MQNKEKTIYALGFFDGVHLGHQALLRACRNLAEQHGCRSGVVTFDAHPEKTLLGSAPELINSPEDRQILIRQQGIDAIVSMPFDDNLRKMPWQDFLRLLLTRHNAAGLVCGEDFRFGHKGQGTAALLQQFCREEKIPCAIIPQQFVDGIRVSSSHIRSLLEKGDVAKAKAFLGRAHLLTGEVISGRGIGRTMGIPTANMAVSADILLPRQGVYACTAAVEGKTYPAVTNIGSRPTVGGHHVTVEPWLLDFAGDLYEKKLTLFFHAYLRPEEKFDSLEALQKQIREDAEKTRIILKNILKSQEVNAKKCKKF